MKTAIRVIGILAVVISLCGGCSSPAPTAKQFEQIGVGVTTSTEVLTLLPDKGLLHNEDAVSSYSEDKGNKELGIVVFNEQDSKVRRKDYVRVSGAVKMPPFTEQRLYLYLATEVPASVLDELYESESAKQVAILKYCHEMFVEDGRKFSQDEKSQQVIGLVRGTLGYGLDRLASRPREGYRLGEKQGFDYLHPVVGKCRLYLHATSETQYTLELTATDWVDSVDKW